MRAYDITEKTMEVIASGKYDFVVVNLSNADMIGHTGNFEATKTLLDVLTNAHMLLHLQLLPLMEIV